MTSKRFIHKRRRGLYSSEKSAQMNKARWDADRADRITMENPDGRKTGSHGWPWVMTHLRPYLAGRK
jgi:hypothetical protein